MTDKLDFSIGNAAGTVKTAEQVVPLLRSAATDITIGSYTLKAREGNPTPNYWCDRQGPNPTSLNTLGLPNRGIRSIETDLPDILAACEQAGKRLRVSVAGFSVGEFVELIDWGLGFPFAAVEANFGCPNVNDGGTQKPIFAFDVESMRAILSQVEDIPGARKRISLKLSPYSDPSLLKQVARMLGEFHHLIQTLVICNTFPNAFAFGQDGKPVFGGWTLGGLAGKPMKHIALGQVRQFTPPHSPMPIPIKVIGVGGIGTGIDLIEMLDAGADGVQVATAFLEQGPRVFSDILEEFARHQEMLEVGVG